MGFFSNGSKENVEDRRELLALNIIVMKWFFYPAMYD